MDDVGDFEDFVHQGDVAVGEVDACTSSRCEVVRGTNCGGDDQVVDDFAVNFRDHFVRHEVGESCLCIDVVDGFEVLGGFEGPGGFQFSGDGGYAVTVDAEGDFWLEGVGFEVVLVVDAGDGSDWE